MTPLVTLTTDFGTRDGYVAQMKGVLLTLNPEVRVVDATHEIEPFSVLQCAFVLKGMRPYFPSGTVHVAVVDPGVGSSRKGIALRTSNAYFVGPDNGVFTFVAQDEEAEARSIDNPDFMLPQPHPTFHGRDVFASGAAHLSLGRPFQDVGEPVTEPETLPIPAPVVTDRGIRGELIYADRFGNLTSNIDASMLTRRVTGIHVGETTIPSLSAYFDQVTQGEPLALVNSFGHLEIAVNRGSAARHLAVGPGATITVDFL